MLRRIIVDWISVDWDDVVVSANFTAAILFLKNLNRMSTGSPDRHRICITAQIFLDHLNRFDVLPPSTAYYKMYCSLVN